VTQTLNMAKIKKVYDKLTLKLHKDGNQELRHKIGAFFHSKEEDSYNLDK
jgi:hypothetical protein